MALFLQFHHPKTILCFDCCKHLKIYGKKCYSSKVKYIKIYPDIMIKTEKLHKLRQYW